MPLLALEVVSHSTAQVQDNDLIYKRIAYARMGIREYWLVDTKQDFPLRGYTLHSGWTQPHNGEYQLISIGSDGGQPSRVLGTSLRWVEDALECWHAAWAHWVPVVEIPILEREAEVAFTNHLELLPGMGVPMHLALELGLDLLCMDSLPGVRALASTKGDLWQLCRYISLRLPGRDTAANRDYVTDLLRAGPTYPSNDYTGAG